MYRIGRGGMEKINPLKSDLPFGSRVIAFGANNWKSTWAVCGDDNRLVKMSTLDSEDYFANPFKKVDRTIQPLSEKFGIGFYYDDIDEDFRFTTDEMKDAILRAEVFLNEQRHKELLKTLETEKLINELPKLYPHLTPNVGDDYRVTKRNLVAELKHRFPETKFSVRQSSYKVYDVYWGEGAAIDDVAKVRALFEDHETDFTGDFRDYKPSTFNRVFGGFKYIFLHRG